MDQVVSFACEVQTLDARCLTFGYASSPETLPYEHCLPVNAVERLCERERLEAQLRPCALLASDSTSLSSAGRYRASTESAQDQPSILYPLTPDRNQEY